MFGKMFKNQKAWCFAGGVISATIGVKLLKSEASRKLCVKGVAGSLKLKDEMLETIQNIREEAADIYHDAKNQDEAAE